MEKTLKSLLKYYREFRNELWLLMKKFDETELLLREYYRICGIVDILEELVKNEDRDKRET